ncbi:MAG: hypothetical protein WAO98_01380 [Alphaproteobacteria bacterium]
MQPELLRVCNAAMRFCVPLDQGRNYGEIIKLRDMVLSHRNYYFLFQRSDVEELNTLLEPIGQTASPEDYKKFVRKLLSRSALLYPAFQAEIQSGINERAGIVPVKNEGIKGFIKQAFRKCGAVLAGKPRDEAEESIESFVSGLMGRQMMPKRKSKADKVKATLARMLRVNRM